MMKKMMKNREGLREQLANDLWDEVSAWIHEKILRRLHWSLICVLVGGIFGIEMVLNFLFVDHVMLAFDEWMIGISLSALANEFRYRRKLRKALPEKTEETE